MIENCQKVENVSSFGHSIARTSPLQILLPRFLPPDGGPHWGIPPHSSVIPHTVMYAVVIHMIALWAGHDCLVSNFMLVTHLCHCVCISL